MHNWNEWMNVSAHIKLTNFSCVHRCSQCLRGCIDIIVLATLLFLQCNIQISFTSFCSTHSLRLIAMHLTCSMVSFLEVHHVTFQITVTKYFSKLSIFVPGLAEVNSDWIIEAETTIPNIVQIVIRKGFVLKACHCLPYCFKMATFWVNFYPLRH